MMICTMLATLSEEMQRSTPERTVLFQKEIVMTCRDGPARARTSNQTQNIVFGHFHHGNDKQNDQNLGAGVSLGG